MSTRRALIGQLIALPPIQRWSAVAGLSGAERRQLLTDWSGWAHPGQETPPGDWRVWMMCAGRGFGKTRAGAEWVAAFARARPQAHIALVAATAAEGRRVMVEGPSGVLAVARFDGRVEWSRLRGEIRFPSGATATLYSAAAPESLRGPQHDAAWCDELAKWRWGEAAWNNLMLGLRSGEHPRAVVTTTPLPIPLVREVIATPGSVVTRGRTQDNPHLPAMFATAMQETYRGTRLARQELDGELLEDHEGALWTRALIDRCRLPRGAPAPALARVVVAVDPPASAAGDACGIVAVGLDTDGRAVVLEDASIAGLSPAGWARAVAACAGRHGADLVIAEANQGGDMVREVLIHADRVMPVRLVHATRGKLARAEPVSHLYEQGRVRHADGLHALEDQLCGMLTGGIFTGPGRSPDRADALIWAVTELLLRARTGAAGVRQL